MTLWPLDDVNEADRNRACALLEWLLQSEPSQRPSSAAQVLDHPFFSHGWSKAGPGLNGEYVDELNASVEVVESEARGQRLCFFCPGGARPQTEVMVSFIDEYRDAYGVEPICKELPIAPST